MRNVILWDMVSVDGFIETANKEIGWFRYDEDLEKYIRETNLTADTLLFGRTTYEMMAAYWQTAEGDVARFMNSILKVVFSTTLDNVEWNNSRLVKDNAPEEVAKLKREPGNDIFVFGSAGLTSTLMAHDLVDEIRLGINPVLLGSGTPLFRGGYAKMDLKLEHSRVFKSGLVILHYRPERRA
jgi:dihydrofolate reductase